jgi:uncharacterized protein (TIGR02594 family)
VLHYYERAGHGEIHDDDVPWCAAFVGAMLADVGIKGSHSLAARSYETWGVSLQTPIYGCVGVKKRRGGAVWQGHVGFVVAASADRIWLLAGNQGDAVSVASFPREDFTAFRWPARIAIPTDLVKLPTSGDGAINVSEA